LESKALALDIAELKGAKAEALDSIISDNLCFSTYLWDKTQHPYWQNYLYESHRFRESCCGMWGFIYECVTAQLSAIIARMRW